MIFDSIELCIPRYYKPREKLFKNLMGKRIIDALLHMPLYTIEKRRTNEISQEDIGKIITTKIKVDCIDVNYRASSPAVVYGRNGSNIIEIVLFNYPKKYIRSAYPMGQEIGVSGKLTISSSGSMQFINPEKFVISRINENSGLFNIYPLTTGLTQNAVYSVIKGAFAILEQESIEEWLPENLLNKNEFPSFKESLRNIHFPKTIMNNPQHNSYLQRLIFDELLAEQVNIYFLNQRTQNGYVISNNKTYIEKLLGLLPFPLTNSQNKVISEIFQNLQSGYPMFRLLQGDVGSGKTIVALISALYVIESGFQCALLAPIEILARQHYQKIQQYFAKLGLSVEILTGNEKGKKRSQILDALASGKINLLIGTHTIITEKVTFHNLGLAIIDEQHRFGVNQRKQLVNKGITPHVLSMSATPIPRTMVMLLYGDIDVSTITEKPANRLEILTRSISMKRIPEIVERLKNIINSGQKVYWICPLIEDSEKLRYTCVTNRFEFLKKHFGDEEVEMLHGKMKTAEKDAVFENFKNGNCKILVSTTVIEVGIDVPEATVIIIENAEKFGLSQLHQLRGRVGRGDKQSYCLLLFDEILSNVARQRLQTICNSSDGFQIAEQDLKLRGGGDVIGIRQSGEKQYKTFDINDPEIQEILPKFLNQIPPISKKCDQNAPLLQVFQKL